MFIGRLGMWRVAREHAAALLAGDLAVTERDTPVDEDEPDPFRQLAGVLVGRVVDHRGGIEHRHVRRHAGARNPRSIMPIVVAGSAVILRTASSHVSALLIADVAAEHARKRARTRADADACPSTRRSRTRSTWSGAAES